MTPEQLSPTGPPPAPPAIVTAHQLHVVAGYMLFLASIHQQVTAAEVKDFVFLTFRQRVTKDWVAHHVHQLGFSSHRPSAIEFKYHIQPSLDAAIETVTNIRPILLAFNDKTRTVCIDQISFWDNGIVTSSYALIGGCVCVHCDCHVW